MRFTFSYRRKVSPEANEVILHDPSLLYAIGSGRMPPGVYLVNGVEYEIYVSPEVSSQAERTP